ncbi:sensor histidine kinase [Xylophilus sp. GOD-11R]|uniref:sensor histidine kinase n=1 Tax=Xylophilus sp. GOD-11R TaxID=3089814 RepID=UPI00298BFA8C|nr:sensor histidine kinase [Xylophilus sp. GOD-11R]WPB55011.1 sensor histidine kinase [Xylophilus sp. GOD-11R]
MPPNGATDTRRSWRTGIRTQLLLLLLPGLAALLAFDSWTDYRAMARTLESAYDESLLEAIGALDIAIVNDRDGGLVLSEPYAIQAMFESLDARHKHLQVLATPERPDDPGAPPPQTLFGTGDLPAPPPGPPGEPAPLTLGSAPDARIAFYNADYRGYPVRIAALQRRAYDGLGRGWQVSIRAAESTGRRNAARQALLRTEILQGLRMLAVTVVLVWLGIALALRPLQRLRAALRARPAHDLRPLEAGAVPGEVAPLVDAVNHHIADHRAVLERQAGFLADASHQLRTPLAIMTTQAGYALRQDEPGSMRESLAAIAGQLERSRRLSDQLLAMAHASRAAPQVSPPVADLNAVAREVVLQYLPLAREKHIDLGWSDLRGEVEDESTDPSPVAPLAAEPGELHEALANLLHNAIRHTPRDGHIDVAVRREAGTLLAEVADSGPGLPAERREAVFQRFNRSPPAPGAPKGGAGLGLAIARAYARRNGGDIVFADPPPGCPGLVARLVFPLSATPARHPQ